MQKNPKHSTDSTEQINPMETNPDSTHGKAATAVSQRNSNSEGIGSSNTKQNTSNACKGVLIDWETNVFLSFESPQASEIILITIEELDEEEEIKIKKKHGRNKKNINIINLQMEAAMKPMSQQLNIFKKSNLNLLATSK